MGVECTTNILIFFLIAQKSVLKNMCDIDISDVTIKQGKYLSTNYSIAHSVHYEDF